MPQIPVSLVSYLLDWVPHLTVAVTYFFLYFFGRNGHYGFDEDPVPEIDDTFFKQDPMSDPSYTNLNMSEQWFFKEAIMIVIPLFETRVLKDHESVVIDCSSSIVAPTGLTRTRYLQKRSVYQAYTSSTFL